MGLPVVSFRNILQLYLSTHVYNTEANCSLLVNFHAARNQATRQKLVEFQAI